MPNEIGRMYLRIGILVANTFSIQNVKGGGLFTSGLMECFICGHNLNPRVMFEDYSEV